MRRSVALCVLVVFFAFNSPAQIAPSLIGGMKWRQIAPFRGGRAAVVGVRGDPNNYYFGAVAGSIFKSMNGGLSWAAL